MRHVRSPGVSVLVCLLVLGGWYRPATAAVSAPASTAEQGIRPKRLAMLGGAVGVLHYVGFRYFDRAWYMGQKQDHIRWINDWGGQTYLNLDKGAHFMGGLVMAQSLKDALVWSGFGPRPAVLLGTAASWAFLMEIEMRDAYYDQWGFSIPDFTCNTVGALIPLLQTFVPQTRVVQFKFSYHPSSLYLDRDRRTREDRPHFDHIIDDYEGMTFWISVAPESLLPERAAEAWPDYLAVAFGWGASGLHGSNVKSRGPNKFYPDRPDAQPEFFLGLDYDVRCRSGASPRRCYLRRQLNLLHLPAPAVRVYPDFGIYLLYM